MGVLSHLFLLFFSLETSRASREWSLVRLLLGLFLLPSLVFVFVFVVLLLSLFLLVVVSSLACAATASIVLVFTVLVLFLVDRRCFGGSQQIHDSRVALDAQLPQTALLRCAGRGHTEELLPREGRDDGSCLLLVECFANLEPQPLALGATLVEVLNDDVVVVTVWHPMEYSADEVRWILLAAALGHNTPELMGKSLVMRFFFSLLKHGRGGGGGGGGGGSGEVCGASAPNR